MIRWRQYAFVVIRSGLKQPDEMKNAVMVATLCTLATTSFSQVVIRVAFKEMGPRWHEIDQSFLSWEVWRDPVCGDIGWNTDARERVDDDFIAESVEFHKPLTDKYEGDFMLELPIERFGIYHIGAYNKNTGEFLGSTACSVDNASTKFGGGCRWPNPINDDPVIGLTINGPNTIFSCVNMGNRTPYDGWVE